MIIRVFLPGSIVLFRPLLSLPDNAAVFAAEFANVRAILAAVHTAKLRAAIGRHERVFFLAPYNSQT
jgi:hypothetical protein